MARSFSTGNLAKSCAGHPKRVIGIWLGILVAAFVVVAAFSANTMTTEFAFFSNPDSKKASTQTTLIYLEILPVPLGDINRVP